MIDIDKLNRNELINFLSHAFNVVDFQESHSNEYRKLVSDIANKAYDLYTKDELSDTYPKLAERLNENEKIKDLQSRINEINSIPDKKKIRIEKSTWKLLLLGVIALIILHAFGSILLKIIFLSLLGNLINGLCTIIFTVMFYGLIGYLIYIFFKNRKISKTQYKRNEEKDRLLLKRNKLAKDELFEFADRTQEAKKYMEDWNKEIEQLPSEDLDCFSTLSDVDQAYCNTDLISKMIKLLRQHRSHDFESTINLIISEVRQEKIQDENREMMNSVSNDVKHMENNLYNLGQQALNKLDQDIDLSQQVATNTGNTAKDVDSLADDVNYLAREAYKEAHQVSSNDNQN
ncbi:hypothetical protein OZX58_06615 [Lactobacillus sp. ESL0680]|uniref:hypothetical protein n=1 Tax=Lactobacillus sp. ESL0680 TaxID=2983210 RepID=UPI0023F950B9|nr:hypothetical protein [Lactobacillus sp. ESL0680]WEV38402.1 hypothetical protein OZX58_06615 [Lactobacillus sp. ESL0680]